jgi:hypothetical protein
VYFGNYERVVLLSQTGDPAVVLAAEAAATRLRLAFLHEPVGRTHFGREVAVALTGSAA